MKKKAVVSISSVQIDNDDQTVEVVTPGEFHILENGFKVIYEESEISGMEGTTTSIIIEEGKLTLERKGSTETVMVFEKEGNNICLYNTPYGMLELRVKTKSLDMFVNEKGGKAVIDYELSVATEKPIKTNLKLGIKVLED